jgi:hypothetical protein
LLGIEEDIDKAMNDMEEFFEDKNISILLENRAFLD